MLDTNRSTNVGHAALHGVRVLDFATMIVGPLAAQSLGDMGAEVIKVEPPEGDLLRNIGPKRSAKMGSFFLASARNKRSMVLDLKVNAAQEVLERLIKGADILIHSVRTQAAERVGLGYERLQAINPRLVVCHGKGYLDEGLYAGQPAYDDVIQAASGVAMLQSFVAGEPRYVPTVMADKITALQVAFAALAALSHRDRTGEGQYVEIPMFETLTAFNLLEHLWGQTFIPPLSPTGYTSLTTSARRPFQTMDGEYLCVVPVQDHHWQGFCDAAGDSGLASDPRYSTYLARQADQAGYYTLVGELIKKRSTAEWTEALTDAGVPFSRVNSTEDLLTDQHLESVRFWETHMHSTEGSIRMAGIPFRMSKSPPSIRRLAPNLGEHTFEVAKELGYGISEIRQLESVGAFG
jgi:crotonobetainyl-CoA:carnitine CoA-transferase CaiB-like acyl-CoA transferase